MEHSALSEEMSVMATVDFVVPLKQVGIISRSVLEAIHEFYRPRRIIVVTKKIEGEILNRLLPYWRVGPVQCIDEETFFMPNFGLTFDAIVKEYDPSRPGEIIKNALFSIERGTKLRIVQLLTLINWRLRICILSTWHLSGDQREPGWWIQQLIKLGASTQIPNISSTYVVWDGDLVPTRRWKLCSKNPVTGNIEFHIAILQGESRSEFNTTQYANCMRALTGFTPLEPVEGGTFVAHHMVFQAKNVSEMLQLIADNTGCSDPWPLMIMAASRKFYRFSEYKTYATFMLKKHPEEFHYHELPLFGEGGLRFREANTIVDDMLKASKIKNGGLSFGQVKGYVMKNWRTLTTPGQPMPAYIQLDHVYGLSCFDLNMSRVPPRGKRAVKHFLCSNPTPASAPTPAPIHMISLEGMGMSRCIDSEGMHAPPMITNGPWIRS